MEGGELTEAALGSADGGDAPVHVPEANPPVASEAPDAEPNVASAGANEEAPAVTTPEAAAPDEADSGETAAPVVDGTASPLDQRGMEQLTHQGSA
jgi:hypothetical protein